VREQKKIVVFDFDGVVCDSTDECMVTSWNAWEKWESRLGFRKTVDDFSEEEKYTFREVRPRVRGAGEYYILRRAFAEGIWIENQEIYEKLEEDWKEYLSPFKTVFFEARNRLRHENLDDWIDLHPIYNGVVEVMKTLKSQGRLYMATLKDGESVRLILGKQGLEIPVGNFLDQSKIKSKLQALDQFRKQIGCDKTDMIFIDDNITHLIEPKAAGYQVYLTTWGSTIEEYIGIAQKRNIPLLNNCKKLIKIL
jgi:phosphoglycolate phosphatase-like HAD superfamily hydrolase